MDNIVGPQKGRKAVRFGTRLPMRYIVKSLHTRVLETKEAVVTNMSATGIQFEAEEQLGIEVTIAIEIHLPKNIVIEAIGKVARVIPVEVEEHKYYRISLTFVEISDTVKEQINMWYYSEKFTDITGTAYIHERGKRESKHFKVGRVFAEYRKKGLVAKESWKQAGIKSISKYGLVLAARTLARKGEVWQIMIHLPAYGKPIKAVVKVARVEKGAFRSSEVAVEFIKIRADDRKKLSHMVHFALKSD